jgi:hypothetical protein
MEPRQRAAVEAILGYPLAPWLDNCGRAVPPDANTCAGARPWPTWIRLDVEADMEALAAAYPPETRAAKAYALYEPLRPDIPAGKQGWGVAGSLDLDDMRARADDTTVNMHRTRP